MPPNESSGNKLPRGGRLALLAAALAIGVLGAAALVAWPRIQAWYRFRKQFEPLGENAQGCLEYRHQKTGLVFVRIPGGTFSMGSSASERESILQRLSWSVTGEMEFRRYEEGLDDEEPVHSVRLTPFLMAKHEVSEAEFLGSREPTGRLVRGLDLPVTRLGWYECRDFCERNGLRLPTEAQWEYACRGGADGKALLMDEIFDLAWCRQNSGGRRHRAGTRAPNEFGLHDMLGNVWEWCEDGYQGDFYSTFEQTAVDPQRLPLEATSETSPTPFVLRGGGWNSVEFECRAANRQPVSGSGYPPHLALRPGSKAAARDDVGFRPVYWPLP